LGWAAVLAGDVEAGLPFLLDPAVLETPLVGEGMDQKAGWKELLRRPADAARRRVAARAGKKCRVASFEEIAGREPGIARFSAPLRRPHVDDSGSPMSCAQWLPKRSRKPP